MPEPDPRPSAVDAGTAGQLEPPLPEPRPRAPVDPAAVRASYARLSGILADMMPTVVDLSTRRCPYKDVAGRCTAAFGCRNQRRSGDPGTRPICAGDDRLDYRAAWETG